MNGRVGVSQRRSSPTLVNFLGTNDIETTSSIVYEERSFVPVYDGDNTSQTHDSRNTMGRMLTKDTQELEKRRQLERKCRTAKQKALLQPCHHLEQNCDFVAAQLLRGRYPHLCCDVQGHHDDNQGQDECHIPYVSGAGPTVVFTLGAGNKQNSIKRPRSQSGTPMEVSSPDYKVNIKKNQESNNYDVSLGQSQPPLPPPSPLVPFVSPLYVDTKLKDSPGGSMSKESMLLLPTGTSGFIPLEVAGRPSDYAPSVSPEALHSRNVKTHKGIVREKNVHNILSTSDDFRDVSPPLYITSSSPSAFASALTPDPHFERNRREYQNSENAGVRGNKKHEIKNLRARYAARSGLMTPSVTCVLQAPPWKTLERLSPPPPPPKNRIILTPPRPLTANMSTDFQVESSFSPVFAGRGLVPRKYQGSCSPCTPNWEGSTGLRSPLRPLGAIIDTWQGLSAHYRRTNGLKTPIVPLLLKKS